MTTIKCRLCLPRTSFPHFLRDSESRREQPAASHSVGRHRRCDGVPTHLEHGPSAIAEKLGLGQRSELFNIVIQAGAILAVTVISGARCGRSPRPRDPKHRSTRSSSAAFGITAVLGLVVTKLGFELPEDVTPVAWALIIGGIWTSWQPSGWPRRSRTQMTWPVAIIVGLAQIVAGIFPGTSRSGATIFAAMLAGTSDRRAATEFSFLVGIPTMYAASGYALLKQCQSTASARELVRPRRRLRGLDRDCVRRRQVADALHPDAHVQRVRGLPRRPGHRPAVAATDGQLS